MQAVLELAQVGVELLGDDFDLIGFDPRGWYLVMIMQNEHLPKCPIRCRIYHSRNVHLSNGTGGGELPHALTKICK